jgi:methyl-accepting chemotaxis protein
MTAQAQGMSEPARTHPPRKLRNFLLEPRFQLKYTFMVVGVTVFVAAVLGYYAYQYSTGQTQLLNIERMEAVIEKGGEPDEQFIADLEQYARDADRKVAMAILGGILALALALGGTGIIVTHRLVGPAYRLRRLIKDVGGGRLVVEGGLRKGDELQDVFEAFRSMVESMRGSRQQVIDDLEVAITDAKEGGGSDELTARLEQLRDRLRASLD